MSALMRINLDVSSLSTRTVVTTCYASGVLSCLTTPSQHSLLLHTISWLTLGLLCLSSTGTIYALDKRSSRGTAFAAGFLFGLRHICERAVGAQDLWWSQVLLPAGLLVVDRLGLCLDTERSSRLTTSIPVLGLFTLCALVTSYRSGSETLVAFGLSNLVLSIVALLLLERALRNAGQSGSVIYSANGYLSQPQTDNRDAVIVVLRDIAIAAGGACFVTAIAWESWRFDGLAQWGLFGRILGDLWIPGQSILSLVQAILSIIVQIVYVVALASSVHRERAHVSSFVLLAVFSTASLLASITYVRFWFFCLTGAFLPVLVDGSKFPFARILMILAGVSLLAITIYHVQPLPKLTGSSLTGSSLKYNVLQPLKPVRLKDDTVHPIAQLIADAQTDWSKKVNKQSRTLSAAVVEYRRRYGISPPPNFDKWLEYATLNDVQMIDEYDTIYDTLLPFWALSPLTIRERARESIGNKENNLLGLLIRGGQIVHVENADDWQQRATVGLIEKFVQYLPDMDLAFNIHDEPRVVVPADQLSRLVGLAQTELAKASAAPDNAFIRSDDLNPGRRIEEVKYTKFNSFAHQRTWGPSVISCPAGSPVGSHQADNLTSYALGELGFVYNSTAFSNVCNSPSFEVTHGFFERANAFSVVHDLYPIFSQSKMSCFQDIVYPSPWYWYDKTAYHEILDPSWEDKQSTLYWRGSTTGGYSKDGGWRRQHRQVMVRKLNAPDRGLIMEDIEGWTVKDVPRLDYKDMVDVRFSNVKQCEESDCAAQKEFFSIAPKSDQQDAWKYKYLLDMDGNAYSGRFYAFLKSHSLVFKMAVFREWHEEWLKPWVHYIPLSLRGDDILEAVRYIDAEGQEEGAKMAKLSTDWAQKTLRNVDFEAWFFRMLLEYGRLVDDNRLNIGFR